MKNPKIKKPVSEPVKSIRGITVIFTLETLKAVCRTVQMEEACYGEVVQPHTKVMGKIIDAMALGKTTVII
ncbi:hypothetical protein LCGC14_1984590 [marine sediment metagenome]|uniref:Uncharacterized protein n=1 Tax=marine sediment metagenome TaxID=412755 RepID=A0A0F9FW06_9ZZZZ